MAISSGVNNCSGESRVIFATFDNLQVYPLLAAFNACSTASSQRAAQIGSRISPKNLTRILPLFSKFLPPYENAVSPACSARTTVSLGQWALRYAPFTAIRFV
jgi:hypothetical protein